MQKSAFFGRCAIFVALRTFFHERKKIVKKDFEAITLPNTHNIAYAGNRCVTIGTTNKSSGS